MFNACKCEVLRNERSKAGADKSKREIGVNIAVRWHVNKRWQSNRYIADGSGAQAGRWLCAIACRRHHTNEPELRISDVAKLEN